MASKFLKVKCECGAEQTIFSKVSMEVKCTKCDKVLAQPTGGKAAVSAEIVETF